jgi:hypothetical protein
VKGSNALARGHAMFTREERASIVSYSAARGPKAVSVCNAAVLDIWAEGAACGLAVPDSVGTADVRVALPAGDAASDDDIRDDGTDATAAPWARAKRSRPTAGAAASTVGGNDGDDSDEDEDAGGGDNAGALEPLEFLPVEAQKRFPHIGDARTATKYCYVLVERSPGCMCLAVRRSIRTQAAGTGAGDGGADATTQVREPTAGCAQARRCHDHFHLCLHYALHCHHLTTPRCTPVVCRVCCTCAVQRTTSGR